MGGTFIVIPAYNEEKHIKEVVLETKKYCNNIIVVDDGSKDNTFDEIKDEVIALKHIINLGKGAALKTGCDYALKREADKIIVMDSDGQHDPKDIQRFLEKLKDNDIIFSYRVRSKNMPFILRFGNDFLNKTAEILFKIKIKDTQCGYRAFTAESYRKVRWKSNGYSMESEMIAKAGKRRLRYAEIPIKTIYHDKYKGTTVFDGIKIGLNMLSWRIINLK